MSLYQLPRSYKRYEENKRKIEQVDYTPWMQESVSMHKSPTPVRHSRMNQVRQEKEEKRETVKTQASRLMERNHRL